MQTDAKRLEKVSIGIGLMLASVVVLFLYIVSFIMAPIAANIGNLALANAIMTIQLRFALPILITSTLLGVAGPCLCLAAPREVRGTGFLLISIACNGLNLLFTAAATLIALPGWLNRLSPFLPFAAIPLFILFVCRVATFLERPEIRKLGYQSLILASVAAVLAMTPLALVKLNMGVNLLMTQLILPVLVLLTAVIAFLRYLRMLVYARRATSGRSAGKYPGK